MRVIEQGLKDDAWVVSGGILQVRPRVVVRPEKVPMPTLGQPSVAENQPGETKKKSASPSKDSTKPTSPPPAESKKSVSQSE
jgi:multidrug efflux system membrane fusion protein